MAKESFPDADVTDFLVHTILRPIIDGYIDSGKRVCVVVRLVAGASHRDLPLIGSVGRAVPLTITVKHTRTELPSVSQVTCTCRVDGSDVGDHPQMHWVLNGTLRRDERGPYLQSSGPTPLLA